MLLSPIDSKEPLQAEYEPVVKDLVGYLKGGLGDNLHSVYICGSVARKCAVPHQSNVDIVVITHDVFTQEKTTLFNTIKWQFQRRYPFVTELAFKTALAKEVASLDSLFSWGFMLRHTSICVYGENLAECFGDYEPSWEIAKHWNMDVKDWVAVYRHRIARAANAEEQIKAQVAIAKKLLRASYSVVMPKDKRWFDSPVKCGEVFLQYHPEKKVEIERLGILLGQRCIPKRSVVGLLDGFGQWLVKEYKKTEFRIG
ncbi:nucleotidyltransferase [Vibrio sonorensis]|uniref:nucleotidyltransferase n=1 Tax=Vibrio sonorensis TaxID=1004316 RepID=UPI0008D8FB26|nr:nucleotidyltransferase [Vibrio sonorensis]